MKLVPQFVSDFFGGGKKSETYQKALDRQRERQADLTFTKSSAREKASEVVVSKSSSSSKMDAKTLVMAVSLMVNAGLAGVLYGKFSVSEENDVLKGQVASLSAENQKMSREAKGKIALAPNQRVVTVEEIERVITSTKGAMETVKTLTAQVTELEGKLARYEGRKTSSPSSVGEIPVRKTGAYSQATQAVKAVSSELPSEVDLSVTQNGGLTIVTYSDPSGFTRYFTADRSENASKLTEKGLKDWANEKYMASLDEQARKQGSL